MTSIKECALHEAKGGGSSAVGHGAKAASKVERVKNEQPGEKGVG